MCSTECPLVFGGLHINSFFPRELQLMQPNDILYCEKTNSTEMIFQTLSEMLTEYVKEKNDRGSCV